MYSLRSSAILRMAQSAQRSSVMRKGARSPCSTVPRSICSSSSRVTAGSASAGALGASACCSAAMAAVVLSLMRLCSFLSSCNSSCFCAFFCDAYIFRVDVNSYVLPTGFNGYGRCCAGSDERIEDYAARSASGQYARAHKSGRKCGEVCAFEAGCTDGPYIPLVPAQLRLIERAAFCSALLSLIVSVFLPAEARKGCLHVSVASSGLPARAFLCRDVLPVSLGAALSNRLADCFGVKVISRRL